MKISFLQPDLDDALQFLTDLFETGLSYSSLNTASISINRVNQGCVGQRGATTTALASSNRIFVMQDPNRLKGGNI
jgi:hypothetical protein